MALPALEVLLAAAVVVLFVLVRIVFIAATLVTMLGARLAGVKYNEGTLLPNIPAGIFSLITWVITLVANLLWAISVVFFNVVPYLVLCVFIALVFSNQKVLAHQFVYNYNLYIGDGSNDKNVLYFARTSVWLLKILSETLVPIYNFAISCYVGGVSEMLSVLMDTHNSSVLVSLTSSVAALLREVVAMLSQWVVRNWTECAQTPNLVVDIAFKHGEVHRCLRNGPGLYRALSLAPVQQCTAIVMQQLNLLLENTCPAVGGLAVVVLHPLFDANLVLLLEHVANMVLTVMYTQWDVAHLRCRAVHELDKQDTRARTSLCVPDLAPAAAFASRAAVAFGALLDNWATRAMKYGLRFFFASDIGADGQCQGGRTRVNITTLAADFKTGAQLRALAVTEALTAATDGMRVRYHERLTGEEHAALFERSVDVRAGFAAVEYRRQTQYADVQGNTQTALLGCRCDDTVRGVRLVCEVALFGKPSSAEPTPPIELLFEGDSTADFFASCTDLKIVVQPLRFPTRSMPADGDERRGFYGVVGEGETACLRDPSECRSVDALVYVSPLCGKERSRCVRGLRGMRCYPYCVGLHQRNMGSRAVVLHAYETLFDGTFLTNTDCASQPQSSPPALTEWMSVTTYVDDSTPGATQTTTRMVSNGVAVSAVGEPDMDCVVTSTVHEARAPQQQSADGLFEAFVFAGDAVLTPECVWRLETARCEWVVRLERISSAINNRYTIEPKLVDIPGRLADDALAGSDTFAMLPLQPEPADMLAYHHVSAQIPGGVVFAINPDFDHYSAIIARDAMQLQASSLPSPQLFIARPQTQCTDTTTVVPHLGSTKRVLLCAMNMTRRVPFFVGDDSFVSAQDLQNRPDTERNFFFEAVSYYDEHNILAVVRRGPVCALGSELGHPDKACDPRTRTVSAFYFVHTETLEVMRDTPWAPPRQSVDAPRECIEDPLLPPLGMLGARTTEVVVVAARIALNTFVLNGVGQVQELLTSAELSSAEPTKVISSLCQDALGHGAYEPCAVPPLSIAPLHGSVLRLQAQWRVVVRRAAAYLHVLTGTKLGDARWLEHVMLTGSYPDVQDLELALRSVAAAGALSVGAVLAVLSSSLNMVFYTVEDVVLAYVRAGLVYMGSQRDDGTHAKNLALMFPSMVYNSIHNGAYDAKIMAPARMLCSDIAQSTGDPALPMGRFSFHACIAGFETHRAALRFFSTCFSMLGIAECVCRYDKAKESDCYARVPKAFRARFDNFVSDSEDVCPDHIAAFGIELAGLLGTLGHHVDSAVDALRGVPQQLATYMRLPALSEASCASYTSSLDAAVMLPRPISEFRRCALTQSCFGRCAAVITPFFNAIERSANADKPTYTQNVTFALPPWTSDEGQRWQPVAMQTFTNHAESNCRLLKTVLEAYPMLSEKDIKWRLTVLCFPTGERVNGLLRFRVLAQVDLPNGDVLKHVRYRYTPEAWNRNTVALNEAWVVAPSPTQLARVLLFLTPTAGNNGVYEVVVHGDHTVTQGWVLRALDARLSQVCTHVPSGIVRGLKQPGEKLEPTDLTLPADPEWKIEQVLLLPDPHASSPTAIVVVARLSGMIEIRGVLTYFELALVMFSSEQDTNPRCRAAPMHNPLKQHADHQRSMRDVFKALLQKETLLLQMRARGQPPLVLLFNQDTNTLTEHVVHLPNVYGGENVDGLDLYLNHTTRKTAVRQDSGIDTELRHIFVSVFSKADITHTNFYPRFHSHMLCAHTETPDVLMLSTSSRDEYTRHAPWYNTFTLTAPDADGVRVFQRKPYSTRAPIQVSKTCTYLDCEGCATADLQRMCFIAQRCVMTRCVGTVVNTNNIFCAVGILLREVLVMAGSSDGSLYNIIVELLISVVRQYFRPSQANLDQINLQSVSSFYVTAMCDMKNVLAAAAALMPAYAFSIARLQQMALGATQPRVVAFGAASSSGIRSALSPLDAIEASSTAFAVTQMIYQTLLAAIYMVARDVDIGLCIFSKFMGVINEVNTHIGSGAPYISVILNSAQLRMQEGLSGDICDALIEVDMPSTSQQNSELHIYELIRDGGAQTTRYLSSDMFDISDLQASLESLMSVHIGLVRTWFKLKFSYLIKWAVGMVYGIAGVIVQTQSADCTPQIAWSTAIGNCACGDAAFFIPEAQGADSSGWCTGDLDLANVDGSLQHVYNPYPYNELRTILNRFMNIYMSAVNTHGYPSNQASEVEQEMLDALPDISNLDNVPPLSLLMRCRENYAAWRWDSGAFRNPGQYSDYIARHNGGESAPRARAARQCLLAGSGVNTIEACTDLVYPDRSAYFAYRKAYAESSATDPEYPDACELLSGEELMKAPKLAQCRGDDHFSSECAEPTQCDVNLALYVHNGVVGVMPADTYVVQSSAESTPDAALAQERYETLMLCITAKLDSLLETDFDALVADMDLRVISNEGDVLHQTADCAFLGSADAVDLLPNEPDSHVENMRYRAPPANTRCNGTRVQNTLTEHTITENTCGSPTRVAIITHIKKKMTTAIISAIASLVKDRVREVHANVSDTTQYPCQTCCPDGECAPGTAYGPAIVTDLVISYDALASALHAHGSGTSDEFIEAMTKREVWTEYQTPHGRELREAYARDQEPRRRALGVEYPVNGTLDGSPAAFEFPLERDEDPLSLLTQCHALLRTNMLSRELVDVVHKNETWVTFELLRDMLENGVEWQPLARAAHSSHSTATRPDFVRNLLSTTAGAHILELLLDERLVPADSLFCSGTGLEESRALGALATTCPCNFTKAGSSTCALGNGVCRLGDTLPECLSVPCAESDGNFITYSNTAPSCIENVREFLHTHAGELTAMGFQCSSLMPPAHAEMGATWRSLNVRNGVSDENREHVKQTLHTILGEHNRTARFKLDGDTRVDNVLCERDLNTGGDAPERDNNIARLAFPAVSLIAEAPAITACLAFIMETAAVDIFEHEMKQDTAGRAEDLQEVVEQTRLKREHRRVQCTLQLTRLSTCVQQGAYSSHMLEQATTSPTGECSLTGTSDIHVLRPACLVVHMPTDNQSILYDGHCLNASSDALSEQTLRANEACRVADPRKLLAPPGTNTGTAAIPALSREYVLDTLGESSEYRKSGVLGTLSGSDWLFPALYPAADQKRRAGVPYWPPAWQGPPHGETLVDAASAPYGGGFPSYMAWVTDEQRFVRLPHHLRNATLRARAFGSAGFCRENTFAMPMPSLNTFRVCTGDANNQTNLLYEESTADDRCSASSHERAGGGLGDTIGDWWDLFRGAVQWRDNEVEINDNATEILQELEKALETHDVHELFPGDGDIEDIVSRMCKESAFDMIYPQQSSGMCYKNSECPTDTVCDSAKARCLPVEIEVINSRGFEVEVGVSSRTCRGQGPGGASPWEIVNGLLQAHGMCSHMNAVAYEYMQALITGGQNCTTGDVNGVSILTCPVHHDWYWVREVPPTLERKAHPGVSTPVYEQLGHLWHADNTGFLQLQPHECDHEYIADSPELKMCDVKHSESDNQGYAHWLRTSQKSSHEFVVANIPKPHNEDDVEELKNKLRFMDLVHNDYKADLSGTVNPPLQMCSDFGVCGIQLISVAGKRSEVRKNHNWDDLKICGVIGVRDEETEGTCVLDRHVTTLYRAAYSTTDESCEMLRKPNNVFYGDNLASYRSEDTSKALKILNEVFNHVTEWSEDAAVDYENLYQCAVYVQRELNRTNTAADLYGKAGTAGVYYFYQHAAHEVPLLWWLKYTTNRLFYPDKYNGVAPGDADELSLAAFDTRLDLPYLIVQLRDGEDEGGDQGGDDAGVEAAAEAGGANSLSLRDIWTRSTLRPRGAIDGIVEVVSSALARVIYVELSNNNVEFLVARPKKLKLKKYPPSHATSALTERPSQFETIAFHLNEEPIPSDFDQIIRGELLPEITREGNMNALEKQYENPIWEKVYEHMSGAKSDFHISDAGQNGDLITPALKDLFDDKSVTLVSPFGKRHRGNTNDVEIRDDHTYLRIATFALPAPKAFSISDDVVRKIVESQGSNFSENFKNLCEHDDATPDCVSNAAPANETFCIFGNTMLSRIHEGVQTGEYAQTLSEPKVEISYDGNKKKMYRGLCGDTTHDELDYTYPGSTLKSPMRCTLHNGNTNFQHGAPTVNNGKLDEEYDTSEPELQYGDQPAGESCDYNKNEWNKRSTSHSRSTLYTPYIPLAMVHMQDGGDNGGDMPENEICYRMDSGCLHNANVLFEQAGSEITDLQDIDRDAYARVKYYANLQDPSARQARLDSWYDSYKSFQHTDNYFDLEATLIKPSSTDAYEAVQSRVTNVQVDGGSSGHVQITKYMLNPELAGASYAHLTSKDRLLYTVHDSNSKKQYLFGHDRRNRRRTLAAPVSSFCPSDPASSTYYLHHFRPYAANARQRINLPAYGVQITPDDTIGMKISSLGITVDETPDTPKWRVWEQLLRYLYTAIEFVDVHDGASTKTFCTPDFKDPRGSNGELTERMDIKVCSFLQRCSSDRKVLIAEGTVKYLKEAQLNADIGGNDCLREEIEREGLTTKLRSCEPERTEWPWYAVSMDIIGTMRSDPTYSPFSGYDKFLETFYAIIRNVAWADSNTSPKLCEYTRTPSHILAAGADTDFQIFEKLLTHRESMMLDVGQNTRHDPEEDLITEKIAPCAVPVIGNTLRAKDLVALGACYEQDVHNGDDFGILPWWSQTTCDMLRGFMDGTTHYYALRYWLNFRIPQKFSLSFLTHMLPESTRLFMWVAQALETGESEFVKKMDEETLSDFLTNTIKRRSAEFSRAIDAPRHSFARAGSDVLKMLMYIHMQGSSGTRNFLTPCFGNNKAEHRNAHVIQNLDFSGHCTNGHNGGVKVTKPTLWAELDGTDKPVLVPCSPEEAKNNPTAAQCQPMIKEYVENQNAPNRIVSFKVTLNTGVKCFQDDMLTPGTGAEDFERFVPVHGIRGDLEMYKELQYTPKALWKKKQCRRYDPSLPRRTDEAGMIGAGLYRFDTTSTDTPTAKFISKDNVGTMLIEKIRRTYESLRSPNTTCSDGEGCDALIERIQHRLDEIHPGKYWIKRMESAQDAQQYSMFMKLNANDNNELIDAGIRNAYTDTGCSLSHNDVEGNCIFNSFNGQKNRRLSNSLGEDIAKSCMPPEIEKLDAGSLDGCREGYESNSSRVKLLKTFVQNVYREGLGRKVPIVSKNGRAVFHFDSHEKPSWKEGVHLFHSKRQRNDEPFLRRMFLEGQMCRETWGNVPYQEKTCFKNRGGQITVATPWLGGNYSFPRDPFVPDKDDKDRAKICIGFDMCNTEGEVQEDDSDGFPRITTCHADDCVDIMENEITNSSDMRKVCRELLRMNTHAVRDIFTQTEHELPSSLRGRVAEVLRHDTVLLTQPPSGTCRAPQRRGAQCRHRQAPLGYSDFLARDVCKAPPDFSGTHSITTHKHELRTGRMPSLLNLWTDKDGRVASRGSDRPRGYHLLARTEAQTGPRRVIARVSQAGFLYVHNVQLADGTPTEGWLAKAHEGVVADESKVQASALYTKGTADVHWACPLVGAALFAGDAEFYARHARLRLLTPNPITMRSKYPLDDLYGVHPFVHTQDLRVATRAKQAEYRRVGLGFFYRKNEKDRAALAAKVKQYLQTVLAKIRDGTSVHREVYREMLPGVPFADWPHLPMHMRSGEHSGNITALDLGGHIPAYSAKVKSGGVLSAQHAQTTMQRGGDCHRGHVPKFTRKQVDTLLEFDECHVAGPDSLDCTRAGQGARETVHFEWHPRTVTRADLRTAQFTQPRVGVLNATLEQAGGSAARNVTHELSVGRVVRLSPLYAVVRRGGLERTDLRALWQTTSAVRMQNEAWEMAAPPPRMHAPPAGRQSCIGEVDAEMWQRGKRWTACHDARNFSLSAGCSRAREALDLCSVDELRDVCSQLEQWRKDVAWVNAAAKGQVRREVTLYVPSRWQRGQDSFVGEIVRQTYNHYDAACTATPSDAAATRAAAEESCFLVEALGIVNLLKTVHDHGLTLLDLLFEFTNLKLELLYVLTLASMSSARDIADSVHEKALASAFSDFMDDAVQFLEKLLKLLPDMFNLVWKVVTDTSGWKFIEDIIDALCDVVQVIDGVILSIQEFLNSLPGISFSIASPKETVCKKWRDDRRDKKDFEQPQALLASYCLSATIDRALPVDYFFGAETTYACHAGSFCTPDGKGLQDAPAIPCGDCGTPYGCEMATRRCRCGVVQDLPASACNTARDCEVQGKFCHVQVSTRESMGVQPCSDGRGMRTCYYTSSDAIAGRCAILAEQGENTMEPCPEPGRDIQAIQSVLPGFCLATKETVMRLQPYLDSEDTFVVPCFPLASENEHTMCVVVTFEQRRQVWVRMLQTPEGGRRRLLADAAPRTTGLQRFVRSAAWRLPAARADEHSDCAQVLAACVQAEAPTATLACRACARLWWFWNQTLVEGSGSDVSLLAPHAIFRALVLSADLRGRVLQQGGAAAATIARDWLPDAGVWHALERVAPLASGHVHVLRRAVEKQPPPADASTLPVNTSAPSANFAPPGRRQQANTGAPPANTGAPPANTSTPPANFAPHRRRLQANTSTPPANFAPRRRLLQTNATPDTYRDSPAALQRYLDNNYTEDADAAAHAPDTPECSRMGSSVVDNVLLRFSTTFKMSGYGKLQECTGDELLANARQVLRCPLVDKPIQRWLRDFSTLSQYYEHMHTSQCLQNTRKSCLPTPAHPFTTIEDTIPKINVEAKANNETEYKIWSTDDVDILTFVIIKSVQWFYSLFESYLQNPAQSFLGVVSIHAYSNDKVYKELVKSNKWSLGRVVRELCRCDFDDSINCRRVRSPLHISFFAIFILILLIHFFFPVHPVLSFFLWTLGLSVGVLFLAYGFSPLCFPRVPNCLAEDLYGVVWSLFPTQIHFPALLRRDGCTSGLVDTATNMSSVDCIRECRNPDGVHMRPGISVVFALEPLLRSGKVGISQDIVNALEKVPFDLFDVKLAKKEITRYHDIFKNKDPEIQHAFTYCLFLNSYTLIAWYILLILALPVSIVLLQYSMLLLFMMINNAYTLLSQLSLPSFKPNF